METCLACFAVRSFAPAMFLWIAPIILAGCEATVSMPPATPVSSARNDSLAKSPDTRPSTEPLDLVADGDEPGPAQWKQISEILGRPGELRNHVYVVTIPRDDLTVAIEGMLVPPDAGLVTTLYFYACSCGKMSVVGQFCVTDFEANDVIDALRGPQRDPKGDPAAASFEISSMAPILLHVRETPTAIHFHGEGKTAPLAKTIREALHWMGAERMAPEKPATLPDIDRK